MTHWLTNLGGLSRLSSEVTRSISPENPNGEKGKGARAVPDAQSHAAALGVGWKARPSVQIAAGSKLEITDIAGPGEIRHVWLTLHGNARLVVLRCYWDDAQQPSVECPVSDFFASAWDGFAQVSSLVVCVNPNRGFNCYWPMPFRKRCRFQLENLANAPVTVYYQISYALGSVPDDVGYFHAQFRRTNPVPEKEVHTIVEGVRGQGHYVGTYLAWGVTRPGWWGEGEVKFYLDGDREFPTICGTGTEDYIGGAWNFDAGGYQAFSGPYTGLPQIVRPDGQYQSQQRFGMYRWHLLDPIRFERELVVTIQALGWKPDRFVPRRDDVASVAYWYQTLPTAPFPELPSREALETD